MAKQIPKITASKHRLFMARVPFEQEKEIGYYSFVGSTTRLLQPIPHFAYYSPSALGWQQRID
jgi:hypothetical protein